MHKLTGNKQFSNDNFCLYLGVFSKTSWIHGEGSAVSSPQRFTLYFPDRPVHSDTISRLLWEASGHMLQFMREGCSYIYPPLSIARYSVIQLSELEQFRVKTLTQGFNTAAQDSNAGSRSGES